MIMTLKSTMLIVVASALVAGGAVQLLHAQTKAPHYIIGEISVKDEENYKKVLAESKVQASIPEYGGKYIAVGFNKARLLLGEPPVANRYVIIQFDSAEALQKWWDGPGGDFSKNIGSKYATFRTLAVEGVEPK
jgi:uncharacterized protein (DUF1330 family)